MREKNCVLQQKVIGNWFCAPILKFKTRVLFKKLYFYNLFGFVIRYFLFEKQAFNGLLKVIGIQMNFIGVVVGYGNSI